MKTIRSHLRLLVASCAFAVIFGGSSPLPAQQKAETSLDVVVKISKVEETLNLVDELMATDTGQPTMSPTAMLRGMIQGTDWIDPTRSVVLGVEFTDVQPQMALLIPFQYPNEGFQAAYDAASGTDYYIMALPPGQGAVVSSDIEGALEAASTTESEALLSVGLAANKLLVKADQQIKQGLDKLANMPRPEGQGAPALGPSPEEVRQMLVNCLEVARQVDLLTLGLDINREELSYSLGARALPETRLAKLFSEGGNTSLLDDYRPLHQMNFRSRSFDTEGMMELVEDCFGEVYATMGIDFPAMASIFKTFTGEGAGGVSFAGKGMNIECMYVLKDGESTPDFLETVYVPWMMKYGQDMAAMIEKNTGTRIESPFVRTENSSVSGYKVIGIKTQFPPVFYGPQFSKRGNISSLMAYECRMTTVGNLLLTADTDERMAELIEIAKGVKEGLAEGPLMSGDIDLGGYLAFLADAVPEMTSQGGVLPELGRITFDIDFKDGRADSRLSLKMDDIKTMVAYLSKGGKAASVPSSPSVEEEPEEHIMERERPAAVAKEEREVRDALAKKEAVVQLTEEDARYWLNKGGVCAAYGNDKGAVKYLEKAIALDPNNGDAYFQQGISYGELGRYEEGLSRINKALELGPRRGLYLYGRGRVHLLAGEKTAAIDDFKEAAALGNEDAQDYLQNILQSRG